MTEATSSAPLTLTRVGYDALRPADFDAWHRLRAGNPELDSPYFHPGFAAAVHGCGRPVEVAVWRDGAGEVRALLPAHRDGAVLRPVGWPGADFQGPILAQGTDFRPLSLLSGGVRGFAFDHLLSAADAFAPWTEGQRPSPYLDVAGGLDGYLGRASRSGKDNIGQARRRAGKAERTYGAVKFVADSLDEADLARVIALKREQYAATGAGDYFAEPGRHELLTRLLHTRGTGFAGVLSTVYAGPHLIAAHFGIRSGAVLHWWFPVYDPEFAALGPGWILLRELIAAAPSLGIARIDLGRGDDEYKRRAKTGEVLVSQGLVTRSSARRALRRVRQSVVATVKSTAVGTELRRAVRKLRSRRGMEQ